MTGGADLGRTWVKVGYALTALWMVVVLYVTGGRADHPFFATIFLVPIGGWIVTVVGRRLWRAWRDRGRGRRP